MNENTSEPVTSDRMAWVDTETTGLDEKLYRVIDIAVVITDPHLRILDTYETQIKLSPADRACFSPGAMAVNGFTDEAWKDAPENSREIWERVATMTHGLPLYGQNVDFDSRFILSECRRVGVKPVWDRRRGDTALLSMRLKHVKGLANAKLETSYPALGGPELPPHQAMPDVIRCMWLYYEMLVKNDGLSEAIDSSFEELVAKVSGDWAKKKTAVAVGG